MTGLSMVSTVTLSQTDALLVNRTLTFTKNVSISIRQRWMTIYGCQIPQLVKDFRITTAQNAMVSKTGRLGISEHNAVAK